MKKLRFFLLLLSLIIKDIKEELTLKPFLMVLIDIPIKLNKQVRKFNIMTTKYLYMKQF